MRDIACFGSCCIDYYVNLENGTPFVGGGPLNMAVHISLHDLDASFIGCIGTDAYGKLVLHKLTEKNINTDHLHILCGKTAVSEVELHGEERILGEYEEGVMQDFVLSEEDIAFIRKHKIAITDLWGNQTECMKQIKHDGILLGFDAADRPDDPVALGALPYTDIFFFSSDEPLKETQTKMNEIYEKGPEIVVAMRGKQGSVVRDRDGFHFYDIIENRQVIDSLGAGDSYIAGFLSGLIQKETIEQCMRMGAEEASETLSYHGAFQ
ncbi:MAG: fructoselysine 6-kinase [Solobacterium sp.]|nr:fructoselysine 6-kinase [Solobacterium sp.]